MDSPEATNTTATTTAKASAATMNATVEEEKREQQRQQEKTTTATTMTVTIAKKKKDKQKNSDKNAQAPTPPDGGWGWMVVLSSFMISLFVDGVCFSFGIFFSPLREYYDASLAQTAWVGSVLNGTYLCIGPFVGACVNKFGCRKIAVLGSVVATIAFCVATFSVTISQLIFFFGFLGGIGFGFMYLPAMVMVGYYFENKRALATGMACCGSGIGSFIFAPFSNLLLKEYGWKGAIWILSGIVLNGVVFAIFYRPLELVFTPDDPEAAKVEVEGGGQAQGEPSVEQPLLGQVVDENRATLVEEILPLSLSSPDDDGGSELKVPSLSHSSTIRGNSDSGCCRLIQDRDAQGDKIFPPRIVLPDICIQLTPAEQDRVHMYPNLSDGQNSIAVEIVQTEGGTAHSDKKNGQGVDKLRESFKSRRELITKPGRPLSDIILATTSTPHIRVTTGSPQKKIYRSYTKLKKEDGEKAVNPLARLSYSHDTFSQMRLRKSHYRGHLHSSQHHLEVPGPLMRKDIFYSGSLKHLPEYQTSENLDDYRRKVMTVDVGQMVKEVEGEEGDDEKRIVKGEGWKREDGEGEDGVDGGQKKRSSRRWRRLLRKWVLGPLLQAFDISLLRSVTFVIYCVSCFLCMLGFFVPFIYLPPMCLALGMSTANAAFLISIIGIANTVGRVGVGFVSDRPWADCLLINNVALILGGAVTFCVPFFTGDYALFAVYSFLFGTSIAIFVSLRSIIMVELMGLQKLTNSFGLVIMSQGMASYIGAPIAGMISDLTGDYNVAFYLAGLLMTLSGVICLPLRRIAYWETNRPSVTVAVGGR